MVGGDCKVVVFDNKSSPDDVDREGRLKSDVVNLVFNGILTATSLYSTGNHRLYNFEVHLLSSILSINFHFLNWGRPMIAFTRIYFPKPNYSVAYFPLFDKYHVLYVTTAVS